MNLGKLIKRDGEFFIKDLTENVRHHAPTADPTKLGEYFSFEINEDDDAVDLKPAAQALLEYGIQASTGSFYSTDDDEEAEAFFGTCELTGMKGDVVPCRYLGTDGNVVSIEVGSWLVHSVLGKLAGAF